jgi:hypothetical protein
MNESEPTSKIIVQTDIISITTAYVYVLSRPKHPNFSKVGVTKISAKSRAENYTDGEWEIYEEFEMPIFLARLTERTAHQQLSEYWFDPKITGGTANEVFLCPPDVASIAVAIGKDEAQKQIFKSLGLPLDTPDLIKRQLSDCKKINSTHNSKIQYDSNLALKNDEIIKQNKLYLNKISELERENQTLKQNQIKTSEHLENELKKLNLYYSRRITDLQLINKNLKTNTQTQIKNNAAPDKENQMAEKDFVDQKNYSDNINKLTKKISDLEKNNQDLLNPIISEMEISYEELKTIAKTSQGNISTKARYKLIEAIELASKYRKALLKNN